MLLGVAVPWIIYVISTDEYSAQGCYEDPSGPFLRYLFGFPIDRFLIIAVVYSLAALTLGAALAWAVRGFKRF
jgi:hypothetical protein